MPAPLLHFFYLIHSEVVEEEVIGPDKLWIDCDDLRVSSLYCFLSEMADVQVGNHLHALLCSWFAHVNAFLYVARREVALGI